MSKARDLANAGTALTTVSATELGYLDGATSAIQTQLDAKTAKSTLTTTGDIYYASAANTPARLGIGSSAQVLTVASGVPSWATPSSGGMTLINSGGTTLSGASITISSIPSGYNYLTLFVENYKPATDTSQLTMRFNADSTASYKQEPGNGSDMFLDNTELYLTAEVDSSVAQGFVVSNIYNYLSTTGWRLTRNNSWVNNPSFNTKGNWQNTTGVYTTTGSAITSLLLKPISGNFTSGTAYLYGVK